MIIPNLFLAGAPKCGTTSIYDWLIEHPSVSGGKDKELFYLMDESDWKFDRKRNFTLHGESGYSKLFKEENEYIVDGTTLTVYQDVAIEFARKHNTRAIFCLREPAERVYSTFNYFQNNRSVLDDHICFTDFVEQVKSGEGFSGNNQLSDVLSQSSYITYLRKWCDAIGLDNVLVLVFEDLKKNPKVVMQSICNWLGIDGAFYENFEFKKQNESFEVKSRKLNQVKELIAPMIGSRVVKDIARPIYKKLNTKGRNTSKSEKDIAMISALKKEFEESIGELETQFSLDLGSWK